MQKLKQNDVFMQKHDSYEPSVLVSPYHLDSISRVALMFAFCNL